MKMRIYRNSVCILITYTVYLHISRPVYMHFLIYIYIYKRLVSTILGEHGGLLVK